MHSVPPWDDPTLPDDEPWPEITDLGRVTSIDELDNAMRGQGYEPLRQRQPSGLVIDLINALRFEKLPPAAIVRVLDRVNLFDAWRADPVCLSCGQPGGFASQPRDEWDTRCVVCRAMAERDAREGMAVLVERLKWLGSSEGRRAARANIEARYARGKRQFPIPGRPSGSGDFPDREQFRILVVTIVKELTLRGQRNSQDAVIEYIERRRPPAAHRDTTDARQLRAWIAAHGLDWAEMKAEGVRRAKESA